MAQSKPKNGKKNIKNKSPARQVTGTSKQQQQDKHEEDDCDL